MNPNIFDNHDPAMMQLMADLFDVSYPDLITLFDKAMADQMLSASHERHWNLLNDMFLLFIHLYILNQERKDYYQINGTLPATADLYSDFSIDEIRQYFACHFIEIHPLLSLFYINSPNQVYEGLGYMYIVPGDTPEFIIQ